VRERIEYLAFRLASALAGLVPQKVMLRLGELGALVAYRVDRRRRAMAARHMLRVLGEGSNAGAAAKGVFMAYGRYWAEVFWFRPRHEKPMLDRTTIEGLETVLGIKRRGSGMVLALPHMGNWEMAGAFARRHGIEVVAVAEALPNRRIAEWFIGLRARLGIEVLLTDAKRRLSTSLVEALGKGKAVALVADRDLARRGVPVVFFGEETTLPAGPASLALRAGVPLVPVGTYFEDGTGHRIVVLEPLEPPPGGSEPERVALLTQALARRFEDLIRKAPYQWHLVQPNWPSDRP